MVPQELPKNHLDGPPRDFLAVLRAAALQSAPAAALMPGLQKQHVPMAAYGMVLGQCAEEKLLVNIDWCFV